MDTEEKIWKSAAKVFLPGERLGCLEIIEVTGPKKRKVKCTNCGMEFERTFSSLYDSKHNPPTNCIHCNSYKIGERMGCIELLEKISKSTWKVKCHTCGEESTIHIGTLPSYRQNPPSECKMCFAKNKHARTHYDGEIIGCYRLLRLIGGSNWEVECTKCGRKQIQSVGNMQKMQAEKCYFCDHPDEQYNPSTSHRVRYEDIDERIYNYYKSRIEADNDHGKKYKAWDLNLDQYKKLIHGNCYYCGDAPTENNQWNNGSKRKNSSDGIVRINGIDRLDSSKGYTIDNCVSCCPDCNTLKSTLPVEIFFSKISKIYKIHCSSTIEKHESEPSRVESSDSKKDES